MQPCGVLTPHILEVSFSYFLDSKLIQYNELISYPIGWTGKRSQEDATAKQCTWMALRLIYFNDSGSPLYFPSTLQECLFRDLLLLLELWFDVAEWEQEEDVADWEQERDVVEWE